MPDDTKKELEEQLCKVLNHIQQDVRSQKARLETIELNATQIIEMLQEQGIDLKEVKDSQASWNEIAENTKMIATSIQTYGEQNIHLIDALTGKKQVPLSVFLLVIGIIGVAMLSLFVAMADLQLTIDPNHIEIKKVEKLEAKVIEEVKNGITTN